MEGYSIKHLSIIIKYNLKLCLGWNALAGVLIVALTPLFFYLQQLTYREMATIGELYISLTGVFLFTGAINIDKDNQTEAFIVIRTVPLTILFLIKLCILTLINILLIFPVVQYCFMSHGEFPVLECKWGFLISSIFLGLLGLTAAHIIDDRKTGFIIAIAYFFIEMVTRGQFTTNFYIFSTLEGEFLKKYNVLLLICFMIVINIFFLQKKSSRLKKSVQMGVYNR